jgi:ZIP family zinc transporter
MAGAAALATPLGGLPAWRLGDPGRLLSERADLALRFVVAFGGGLLVAAIALVLVPEGLARLSLLPSVLWMALGAAVFLAVDEAIGRRGGEDAQVLGGLLDSVPESLGLGAAFAAGGRVGPVLVFLVALQNLPQGFNGFRELRRDGRSRAGSLWLLSWTSLLSPLAAAGGYLWLGPHQDAVAALFLAAAGGILYLVVQDVAPMAHKDGHWMPASGAVLGFLVGMACNGLAAG